MARSALLNVMVQAAFKAGKSLSRDFGEVQNLQVSLKGPGDYVSQADRKAEKLIREELLKARPTYGFLGEESKEIIGTDGAHRWIVDPLDGTTNFLHGIPHFSISIALERQGEIVCAAILNPATDELYTAERGGGAFLNDRRLRVAARKSLSDAVVASGMPHLGHGNHGTYLVEQRHVMGEVAGMRCLGAASLNLAYVAAGRVDGLLGARPVLLGHRCRHAADSRSRRLGHRPRWRQQVDGRWNHRCGQRIYPQGAARGRASPDPRQVTETMREIRHRASRPECRPALFSLQFGTKLI